MSERHIERLDVAMGVKDASHGNYGAAQIAAQSASVVDRSHHTASPSRARVTHRSVFAEPFHTARVAAVASRRFWAVSDANVAASDLINKAQDAILTGMDEHHIEEAYKAAMDAWGILKEQFEAAVAGDGEALALIVAVRAKAFRTDNGNVDEKSDDSEEGSDDGNDNDGPPGRGQGTFSAVPPPATTKPIIATVTTTPYSTSLHLHCPRTWRMDMPSSLAAMAMRTTRISRTTEIQRRAMTARTTPTTTKAARPYQPPPQSATNLPCPPPSTPSLSNPNNPTTSSTSPNSTSHTTLPTSLSSMTSSYAVTATTDLEGDAMAGAAATADLEDDLRRSTRRFFAAPPRPGHVRRDARNRGRQSP